MREMALSHPSYKQDSILTPDMTYDIVKRVTQIGQDEWPEELLGKKPSYLDDLYRDAQL